MQTTGKKSYKGCRFIAFQKLFKIMDGMEESNKLFILFRKIFHFVEIHSTFCLYLQAGFEYYN